MCCIGIDDKQTGLPKSQKVRPKSWEIRPPTLNIDRFPFRPAARKSPPLPETPIHLKISIFVEKKIMKNYGMPFKNAAIDKLGDKFGKGQTTKSVTVRPSAEQVSRVKGRMESDINRMDAEIKGYEYASPKSKTGLACSMKNDNCSKEGREFYREVVTKDAMEGNKNKFVGKNIQSTRSAYQGAQKAHSYAKSQYEKY